MKPFSGLQCLSAVCWLLQRLTYLVEDKQLGKRFCVTLQEKRANGHIPVGFWPGILSKYLILSDKDVFVTFYHITR